MGRTHRETSLSMQWYRVVGLSPVCCEDLQRTGCTSSPGKSPRLTHLRSPGSSKFLAELLQGLGVPATEHQPSAGSVKNSGTF